MYFCFHVSPVTSSSLAPGFQKNIEQYSSFLKVYYTISRNIFVHRDARARGRLATSSDNVVPDREPRILGSIISVCLSPSLIARTKKHRSTSAKEPSPGRGASARSKRPSKRVHSYIQQGRSFVRPGRQTKIKQIHASLGPLCT